MPFHSLVEFRESRKENLCFFLPGGVAQTTSSSSSSSSLSSSTSLPPSAPRGSLIPPLVVSVSKPTLVTSCLELESVPILVGVDVVDIADADRLVVSPHSDDVL